jgi:hypothetical protein
MDGIEITSIWFTVGAGYPALFISSRWGTPLEKRKKEM